jgi:MarR family transcriptional regulator, transcriptional regulator for hemolysin
VAEATEQMRDPAPEPLRGSLCWLLSRANYNLTTELTAGLERLGLSPRAHQVLQAALSGERTQIELARMVCLDKTTMVVVIDELEAAGLAERRPSATDRRARVITVTEAGRRKVAEADEIITRIQRDVLAALPAKDREVLLDSLAELVSDRLCEPVATAQPVRRRTGRR